MATHGYLDQSIRGWPSRRTHRRYHRRKSRSDCGVRQTGWQPQERSCPASTIVSTEQLEKVWGPLRRRRFVVFALAAIALSVGLGLSALLAVDLYLHHRAERSAGLNRWGYRGPIATGKQAGEVRIAMLGGSTMFGYGVTWSEAIPALLEH